MHAQVTILYFQGNFNGIQLDLKGVVNANLVNLVRLCCLDSWDTRTDHPKKIGQLLPPIFIRVWTGRSTCLVATIWWFRLFSNRWLLSCFPSTRDHAEQMWSLRRGSKQLSFVGWSWVPYAIWSRAFSTLTKADFTDEHHEHLAQMAYMKAWNTADTPQCARNERWWSVLPSLSRRMHQDTICFRIDRGIAGRIKPYLQPSVQLSENFDILANVWPTSTVFPVGSNTPWHLHLWLYPTSVYFIFSIEMPDNLKRNACSVALLPKSNAQELLRFD